MTNRNANSLLDDPRVLGWGSVLLVLAFWEITVRLTGVNSLYMPRPSQIFVALVAMFSTGSLLRDLMMTLYRVFAGFAIAMVGGATFLPGTIRPADRFVRAYYLITSIPKSAASGIIAAVPDGLYRNQAVAGVASVLRAVSVPFGMSSPGEPNVASTLWRT